MAGSKEEAQGWGENLLPSALAYCLPDILWQFGRGWLRMNECMKAELIWSDKLGYLQNFSLFSWES